MIQWRKQQLGDIYSEQKIQPDDEIKKLIEDLCIKQRELLKNLDRLKKPIVVMFFLLLFFNFSYLLLIVLIK